MILLIDPPETGRVIHDDGVARAMDLGNDLFALAAGGGGVQFNILEIAEATEALSRSVPGARLFLVEAARPILDDVTEKLEPAPDG